MDGLVEGSRYIRDAKFLQSKVTNKGSLKLKF